MHTGREATTALSAHPTALRRYRLLLVATALGALIGCAAHASYAHRPTALAIGAALITPIGVRLVAHHVHGTYAVLGAVALAIAVAQRPDDGITLLVWWSLVMIAAHAALVRPPRYALSFGAICVIAGTGLVAVERATDLGARPLDQILAGVIAYLLVLWVLALPLDALNNGWSARGAGVRRNLTWVSAGALYLGAAAGMIGLAERSTDRGTAALGTGALLIVAAFAGWQAMRIATLTRISRALTEAAITTPWPTDEILSTLVRLVRSHVRARRVAIAEGPAEGPAGGGLCAPLDAHRRLVVERQPGDFGFTRDDARLIAGLASMARASVGYAERERRLERQAVSDHLTGLWSFGHWRDRLVETLEAGETPQIGVVFLDCDSFKQINERYGRLAADQILVTLGARLRDLGAVEDWTFARFGGDQFTGWLIEDGCPDSFDKRCQELGTALAEPIRVGQHSVSVTIGVGRAVADRIIGSPAETVDDLVEGAEIDMRRRKLHQPGAVLTRHTDRDVVRRMLDSGEIAVAYQPIVTLADREVWGCEALLRGSTRTLGLIPPPVLVESASAARLLDAVTREVMEQAITVAEQARAVRGRPVTLTLNLEIDQFHPASDLLDRLVARVDACGVPVILELAERQPMPWTPERDRLAQELASHGIGVGLDDLGSGESRLTLLGGRPWDLLKLDRGLLLEDHGRGPVVLRHLMALLADYGLADTLLEGIETAAQERIALDLGIRYGQGNGYAAAMSGADLLRLLAEGPVPSLAGR
jgi:diguanylate cyclase (GGDEF)-like protein